MTSDRYTQLTWGPDPQTLTPDEIADGWHFCDELDGLLHCPGVDGFRNPCEGCGKHRQGAPEDAGDAVDDGVRPF